MLNIQRGEVVAGPKIGVMSAVEPLVRFRQPRGIREGVEWHACGLWQSIGGRRAVNRIGELIEVISRRAGLDSVGDVGPSMNKHRRGTADDTHDARTGRRTAAGCHGAQPDDAEDDDLDEAVEKSEEDRDGTANDQVASAEPGRAAADTAPLGPGAGPDPTVPPSPPTDSVHPATSPGPSAGMAPRDEKLGVGVDVGG